MATTKIRKRDTGETGNRGEFGTIQRTDAEVEVAPEGTVHVEGEGESRGTAMRVPTWRVDRIEHKVEIANRRLEREGLEERFVLERHDEPVEHRYPRPDEVSNDGYDPSRVYAFQYSAITLNRPSISHEGWKFAAALDRVPGTEEFMLRAAPGHEFGGWRPEPGRCDHCGKFRDRNTTYLVTHPETGKLLQVGASCMEAFLGIKPKGLWALGAGLDEFADDDRPLPVAESMAVSNDELIAKALVASEMGKRYVSRSRALEWETTSTADRIDYLFGEVRYGKPTPEMVAERDEAQAQLQEVLDSGLVDKVVAAAQTVPADSDYGQNLSTALRAGFATESMRGTVISAVSVYGRQLREEAKEKAQVDRVAATTPGFVGPIKERLREVPVTVTNVYESTRTGFAYPYREEPFQIITMRDAEGHEIVWKTGAIQPVEPGATATMTGTVKDHTQYKGVDQTEISRAKLEIPVELGADGFPTEGTPYSPAALGRVGKKLKGEKVRVETITELPGRPGRWTVEGRTTSNHRVSWTTDHAVEAGGVESLSGTIDFINDVGVKTAVIEVAE